MERSSHLHFPFQEELRQQQRRRQRFSPRQHAITQHSAVLFSDKRYYKVFSVALYKSIQMRLPRTQSLWLGVHLVVIAEDTVVVSSFCWNTA